MSKTLSPSRILAIGFFVIILTGALLLMLPIATTTGESTGFLEAVFTATSAVCVTGLVVVDTGIYWSPFGQAIILLLIQVGGLGFMTIGTFAALISGKRIGIKSRLLIQESLGQEKMQGIVAFTKRILLTAFAMEGVGAVLLSFKFIPEFGLKAGIWKSVFHSISAFCNAGFDLMGNYESLIRYNQSFIITFTIAFLIIMGGLGFSVMEDVWRNRKNIHRIQLHTKLVLSITAFLLVVGMLGFYVLESGNSKTIGDMTFLKKLMASFFQSVTPRTAGFNMIDQDAMTQSSKFLTVMLMFIGGSPASTAGGVKTTVLAVVLLSVIAFVKNRELEAYGRRISYRAVNKGIAIIVIVFTLVVLSTMILSIENPAIPFLTILYETVSALGTVGLSLGVTSKVTAISKWVIIFLMYAGRVGALTVVMAVAAREHKNDCRYPEGYVIL